MSQFATFVVSADQNKSFAERWAGTSRSTQRFVFFLKLYIRTILKDPISDYGTLTLLFQDSVGGLEVQNPHTGEFVPAVPIVSRSYYLVPI
jgi:hypothetical protein